MTGPLAFWSHAVANGTRLLVTDRRAVFFGLVPLAAIAVLVELRLAGDTTPHIPLLFNWTASLPYHLAWVDRDARVLARGDFIVYRFEGAAGGRYPGLRGQPFFKRVAGVAGDRIDVRGRHVFVNGVDVGIAKTATVDGWALAPIAPGIVPDGTYYVCGTDPDSFDSRYRESGLVRREQILHHVVPIL